MPDSTVIVAVITGLSTLAVSGIGFFMVRYKTQGKTIRQEVKELRKEVDNLKLQIAPNPTPQIWLNHKEEIITYNGAAATKIFARLGKSGSDVEGKTISSVLGVNNFELIKQAIASPNQVSKMPQLVLGGKVIADFAVVYVIYDENKSDTVTELQLIL